ncbi:MAG: sigma-70 family RNA polymerase sigma factor [Clostridia bacterium]|nr:sigma-70 family RNA polymerase sigma factor [Clostridia bacterium]
MEDNRIIDLFFERSEQALSELSNKYGSLCHRIAFNILDDRLDAEECVNDAFLGVWNTVPPQRPAPLLSYVTRIVRNQALKKRSTNSAAKRNSVFDVAFEELEDCFPTAQTLERECDSRAIAVSLDGFLKKLDKKNRVIFVRRYWFSDSVGEIAKSLGMGEHSVSLRLSRIREKLKKHLEKEEIYL